MLLNMLGNRQFHKIAQGKQLRIVAHHTPCGNQTCQCPGTGSRTVEPHTLAHRPHRRLDSRISTCTGDGTDLYHLLLWLMDLKNHNKVRNFRESAVSRNNLRMYLQTPRQTLGRAGPASNQPAIGGCKLPQPCVRPQAWWPHRLEDTLEQQLGQNR